MSPHPTPAGLRPHLPALLLALFGGWAGTWTGGAGWAGSAAGEAALLLVLLTGGSACLAEGDPLRLGRLGRLLPAALWCAAAASLLASPVPRAGRVGVLLLPLFLALPGLLAEGWREERDRIVGLRSVAALAAVAAMVAIAAGLAPWALGDVVLSPGGLPRATWPLGHHNLLAAWLVLILPLAVLPGRERGPWRFLGWTAGLLGAAAVVATRSLAGTAALAVEILALALMAWLPSRRAGGGPRGGRSWWLRWILPAAVLAAVALSQVERIGRVAGGDDPSARARGVYLRAGLDGFLARPLLGWGPGSTPWTVADFLAPVPGVNPPSELLGELHSLPLQLAYEVGAVGLVLAVGLAGAFAARRLAELARGPDRALAAAGLVALLSGAITALASAALAVTALPVAAAVAAGAALAGSGTPRPVAPQRRVTLLCRAFAAIALVLLVFPLLAAFHAERAGRLDDPAVRQLELGRAVRRDPTFPLYRARLAWVRDSSPRGRAAGAALALQAARDGGAVAPLWLLAGVRGYEARAQWAAAALLRACDLDPLASVAPFYLAALDPESPRAPVYAARALLGDPRLAAATYWDAHPALRERALRTAAAWPGVPPGWGVALLAAAGTSALDPAPLDRWALPVDAESSTALSLHLFRRRPWRFEWPLLPRLRRPAAARLSLPPATVLPATDPVAFSGPECGALEHLARTGTTD